MHHKKTIGIILIATLIFIVGIIIWGSKQTSVINKNGSASLPSNAQADVVFYYGKECPHCINVEKYIADNQIDQKISFAKKEVWHNPANNEEMITRAKECGLVDDKIGVPFLYARGKCYVGEIEVEDFFKKELGVK